MSYSRQELAALGKRASDLHRLQGMDLTEAVVKVASSEPRLTKDHVTRITENANLVTFEEQFKDSDSKHIVFDLADPQRVAQELQPEPSLVSSEYDFEPNYGRAEDVFDQFEEKTSAYRENPEFLENQHLIKLSYAQKQVESDLHRLDAEAERALYALTNMVKQAALQHGSIYGPLQVIGEVVEDASIFEKVALVVTQMLPELPRGSYVDMAPNLNHPLARQYVRVESLTKEASKYRLGNDRLSKERAKALSTKRISGDLYDYR